MSPHDICGKIWNSPHLACVWCRKRRHICKIYAIFLKKSVLWKFTHFVAKSILLQFTRFRVEKNWAQKYICGEKMTNIRSDNRFGFTIFMTFLCSFIYFYALYVLYILFSSFQLLTQCIRLVREAICIQRRPLRPQ